MSYFLVIFSGTQYTSSSSSQYTSSSSSQYTSHSGTHQEENWRQQQRREQERLAFLDEEDQRKIAELKHQIGVGQAGTDTFEMLAQLGRQLRERDTLRKSRHGSQGGGDYQAQGQSADVGARSDSNYSRNVTSIDYNHSSIGSRDGVTDQPGTAWDSSTSHRSATQSGLDAFSSRPGRNEIQPDSFSSRPGRHQTQSQAQTQDVGQHGYAASGRVGGEALSYDTGQTVSSGVALPYDTGQTVSSGVALPYDTGQPVSSARALPYNTGQTVSSGGVLPYDTGQNVSSARALPYNTGQNVSSGGFGSKKSQQRYGIGHVQSTSNIATVQQQLQQMTQGIPASQVQSSGDTSSLQQVSRMAQGLATGNTQSAAYTNPLTQQSLPTMPLAQQTLPTMPLAQQSHPTMPLSQQSHPTMPLAQQSLPTMPLAQQSIPTMPLSQQSHPTMPVSQQRLPYGSAATSGMTYQTGQPGLLGIAPFQQNMLQGTASQPTHQQSIPDAGEESRKRKLEEELSKFEQEMGESTSKQSRTEKVRNIVCF